MPDFRPATQADLPLLQDLAGRIWRACYPGIITPAQIEYMLGWMYAAEKIAGELAAGTCWELVLIEGAPAGFLALSLEPPGVAELHKLYLLPEHHGRGHGQAMLRRAVELAAAAGCARIELRVNKQNARALRSYQRAGFVIREAVVAEIGGGFVMDDFILERAVEPR